MKGTPPGRARVQHRNAGPGQTYRRDPALSPDARQARPLSAPAQPVGASRALTPPYTGDGFAAQGQEQEQAVAVVGGLPVIEKAAPTPAEAARSFRARRRLSLWAGLLVLTSLLLIEFAALSPFTDPLSGRPPREPSGIPLTEVHPYGVNVFLHKEVDRWKREKTLDLANDMGAAWIKQQFPWAEIEFAKNSFWDTKNNQSAWEKFDQIVDLAQARNLRVIARLDSTPEWARTDDEMPGPVKDALRGDPKVPPAPGRLKDFGDFVYKFVSRYKGRVPVIQIWNEPNLNAEWHTGVNAKAYVNLLSTAYMAAKRADPNVIVLAAPLAANNESLDYAGNLNELDYLRAMYYAGALPFFDAMSANAYGKSSPPEESPSKERLNFRRVELLRRVMEENGDGLKSIWFNEYGWNASPAGMSPEELPWGRVTPAQQAEYTVRGIEYARQHWPWAGVFTIWYMRQVGDIPPTKSEYYFSMVNPDFVLSQTYRDVRKAAGDTRQVATPGKWGPLSPPIQAGPRWQVQLNPDVPGGAMIAPYSATIDDKLEIEFKGTDVTLSLLPITGTASISDSNTISARYYLSVDGSPRDVAREIPRDGSGNAFIDAPADKATQVTVVRSLGSEFRAGTHRLVISVVKLDNTQGKNISVGSVAAPLPQAQAVKLPAIGAITVENRRSYVLFTIITLLLAAGIGIEAWALWRSRSQAPAFVPQVAEGKGAAGR